MYFVLARVSFSVKPSSPVSSEQASMGFGTGCGRDDNCGEGSGGGGAEGRALPFWSRKPRRWSSSLQPEGEKIVMTTMLDREGSGDLVLFSIPVSISVVPVETWSWLVRNALSRSVGKDSITLVP